MYLGGHQIACVAGIKKGGGEKSTIPSPFSLLPYPRHLSTSTTRYALKKKVGVLLLDREEKKSGIPLRFSLPPNPPPLSMPAMHATHET